MSVIDFANEVLEMRDEISYLRSEVYRLREIEKKHYEFVRETAEHGERMMIGLVAIATLKAEILDLLTAEKERPAFEAWFKTLPNIHESDLDRLSCDFGAIRKGEYISPKCEFAFMAWLARAKCQQFIPVLAIKVATEALQVFLDAIDGEMAQSAVKSALLANDRVNTAQQISTLREFLRQVKGEKSCADCGLEYCECYLPAWNAGLPHSPDTERTE
jgi:hypothetical protein